MPEPAATRWLIKAHAYGNDFLLAPVTDIASVHDPAGFARRACARHRGVGADGLIFVELTESGAQTRTRLFNTDGSRSEVSGNGVRCVAAWVAVTRETAVGETLVIDTSAGPKRLTLLGGEGHRRSFRADMGAPTELRQVTIDLDGIPVEAVVLRVGNPQCVVLGPLSEDRLHGIAAKLAVHPYFPEGTNVELAQVASPSEVKILIWERGVGPTEASGTGACGAAVAAAAFGGASRAVDVVSPGGTQHVEWTDETIYLTGDAEIIGTIDWWDPID